MEALQSAWRWGMQSALEKRGGMAMAAGALLMSIVVGMIGSPILARDESDATPIPLVDSPGERSARCEAEYRQYKDVCDGRGQTICPGQAMMCREAIGRFRDAMHCASRRGKFMERCRWEPLGSDWWQGHLDAMDSRLNQGAKCLKLAARSCVGKGGMEATAVEKGRRVINRLRDHMAKLRSW